MRLRDLGYDFLSWMFPRRFIPRGTRIAPYPESPEEIARAKREFMESASDEPTFRAYAPENLPDDDQHARA